MKPKPFSALKNFTVPVATCFLFSHLGPVLLTNPLRRAYRYIGPTSLGEPIELLERVVRAGRHAHRHVADASLADGPDDELGVERDDVGEQERELRQPDAVGV